MSSIEKEGKTVDAAVEAACEELGVGKDDLEIEILSDGSSGLLGMFGRKARIRATLKSDTAQPAQADPEEDSKKDSGPEPETKKKGRYFQEIGRPYPKKMDVDPREVLETICKKIYPDAVVEKFNREDHVLLHITADGSGIFIGRKGATLDALQYLINKIMGKAGHIDMKIVVDSEDYRRRKNERIRETALKLGAKAKGQGRKVSTEPLNAYDRRIVHMTLRNDPNVETKSLGQGEMKRVQITPKRRSE